MDNVIKEVKKRQKKEGLSDTKFTKKLGISRHMWEAILKGKRRPGYKTLECIRVVYPDLSDDITDLFEDRMNSIGIIYQEQRQ